jgi:hypothetical protein
MSAPHAAETRIGPNPLRFVATLAVALGVWALAAPRSFAATIAPFAPYNAHYLHDLSALQLGIGSGLLLAARGGDGLLVGLGGYAIGGGAHTLAHLLDRDLGGHPADTPLLGALAALALVALALRARAGPSRNATEELLAVAASMDDAAEQRHGTTRDGEVRT